MKEGSPWSETLFLYTTVEQWGAVEDYIKGELSDGGSPRHK